MDLGVGSSEVFFTEKLQDVVGGWDAPPQGEGGEKYHRCQMNRFDCRFQE